MKHGAQALDTKRGFAPTRQLLPGTSDDASEPSR